MKQEAGLYRLVSEYYEARILNGFYACGENLPSIPKICSVFHMAPATIRAALACLEKSGYIRVDARKAARVVYQAESAGFRENAARYFVPRRDGILDLYQSGQLLFVPLWEAGLRRWEEKDWEELRRDLMDPPAEAVSMPVQFFILALRALDNGLILNLYWEVIRYIRFPYLANREEGHWVRQNLQDLSREEVIALLRGKLETRYSRSVDSLVAYLDRARDEYALEDIAPVPFQWRIYRQRPQLRYTLVSRIIREIYTGVFPGGGYLPSLPQMAERYGVALNTVRRALSVLNCLGLTRSYQGKGTMVCEQPLDGIDVTKPEIRGGTAAVSGQLADPGDDCAPGVPLYAGAGRTGKNGSCWRSGFSSWSRNRKAILALSSALPLLSGNAPWPSYGNATASCGNCWHGGTRLPCAG